MTTMECLYPGDAAAALLVTEDDHYLLQQRDDKPEIFFPGFWGNFGGAIERGESPEDALIRELREELAISFTTCSFFCRLVLDFNYANAGEVIRHFFLVPISQAQISALSLGEGQAFGLFAGGEVMAMAKVVPYDSLVIWQHMTRHMIGGRYKQS